MGDLHTYRITWFRGGGRQGVVKAFTAADAITQFRVDYPAETVDRVEPLPDSPAGLSAEWKALIDKVLGERKPTVPGRCFTGSEPKSATRPFRWHTVPIRGINLDPPTVAEAEEAERATSTARAATPEDRAEALETALRERTAERDRLRAEVRLLEEAICGDALNREALAADPEKLASVAFKHRTDAAALLGERNDLRAILDDIAAIEDLLGLPRAHLATRARANNDRIRALEQTRAELIAERDKLRRERDALAIAACGTAAPDKQGFQGFEVDVGTVLKVLHALHARAENRREVLDDIQRIVWPTEDEAPNFDVVTHAELVEAVRRMATERDALQKRLDAALEYRSAWTTPTPADAIKAMVAILEGRTPEQDGPDFDHDVAKAQRHKAAVKLVGRVKWGGGVFDPNSSPSMAGRWRCRGCKAEGVPSDDACDWVWYETEVRWMHTACREHWDGGVCRADRVPEAHPANEGRA